MEQNWESRNKPLHLQPIDFWQQRHDDSLEEKGLSNLGSIPGLGRSPGEGKGNPLQYSCLESPWTEKPGGLQSMGSREWLNHHHQAKSEQRARQWSTAHCGLYMSGLETESSRWGVGRSVSILDHSALLPSCSIPSFLLLAKAEECINLWKGTNVLEALGRTLPTL